MPWIALDGAYVYDAPARIGCRLAAAAPDRPHFRACLTDYCVHTYTRGLPLVHTSLIAIAHRLDHSSSPVSMPVRTDP
jgi:hypothetical protein